MAKVIRGFEPENLEKLRSSYESEKEFDNLKFLNDLSDYQENFFIGDIIGVELLFYKKHHKRVVKNVLEDLGYKLTNYVLDDNKHILIKFEEKESGI